ncbi:hypothetical protein ScPMuIL_004023 [Solemya velum]
MAGKTRFRIPTAEEMERSDTADTIKPMTVFKSCKNQGDLDNVSIEDKKKKENPIITSGVSKPTLQAGNVTNEQKSNSSSAKNNFSVGRHKTGNTMSSGSRVLTGCSSATEKFLSLTPGLVIGSSNTGTVSVGRSVEEGVESGNIGTHIGDRKAGQSTPQLKAPVGKTNSVIVNGRQRGNPILKSIRNVPWEFGDIVPDYVMGQTNCALFLSLRYHQLNPNYIHERLKILGKNYDLRVLLVQVDIKEPHHLLKDLAKVCILAECTLILAFSAEEAGRYIETYKIYENKPPEALMEKTDGDFMSKLTDSLTTVKAVNKTDCMTLMSTFGSLEKIMGSSGDELSWCPGIGPQKAQRLHDVFTEPFIRANRKRKTDNWSTTDIKDAPHVGTSGASPQKKQ